MNFFPVLKREIDHMISTFTPLSHFLKGASKNTTIIFVSWINNNGIPTRGLEEGLSTNTQLKNSVNLALCGLWVLGHQLQIPSMQNHAMIKLKAVSRKQNATSVNCVPYVWKNTKEGYPLQSWFVQKLAYSLATSIYTDQSTKIFEVLK